MKPSRLNYLGNEKPPRPEKRSPSANARRTAPAQPMVSSNGVPVPESFQIDIAEVLRTIGMHYVHQISIPAIGCFDPETGDVPVAGTVDGKISLTNSGAVLILRGKATANVLLPCAGASILMKSRCPSYWKKSMTLCPTTLRRVTRMSSRLIKMSRRLLLMERSWMLPSCFGKALSSRSLFNPSAEMTVRGMPRIQRNLLKKHFHRIRNVHLLV